MQQNVNHDVWRLQFFIDTAENAVNELVERHLDALGRLRRILQTAVGKQLQHQFIQLTNVRDQALQALAAGGRQVFRQGQCQAEIQARQRRTQFMGNGVKQITLLVEQVLDIAGHGVEHVGEAADVRTRGDSGSLAQVALAEAFGGAFQTFKIAPVRAQPEQQAAEQHGADQHVDAPVQQIDVDRIGRHDHAHGHVRIQRSHRQCSPAPVADAHNVFTPVQTLLLDGGEHRVVDWRQDDVQRLEFLVHRRCNLRPLLLRRSMKLLGDQRLQTSGKVQVVGDEAIPEGHDHQIRHQIDRRAIGDDRHQIQAKQNAKHQLSIPIRSG